MIIFLTSNARFDADNQDALEMLNEWTAGKMWNNLLIVKVYSTLYIIETLKPIIDINFSQVNNNIKMA